jgi:hypothetical protein
VTCFVCGTESEHLILHSTNTFGSSDLDLRPPPMARRTIGHWLQACPCCGYVASELGKPDERVRAVMATKAWRDLTGQPEEFTPEPLDAMAARLGRMKARVIRSRWPAPDNSSLPNIFLRRAFIADELGEIAAAARAALWAAWASDDRDDTEDAAASRRKAALLFKRAIADGKLAGEELQTAEFILVDVLRRSGQWDEALACCRGLDASAFDATKSAMLRFQERLIEARDVRCHKVSDAVDAGAQPPGVRVGPRTNR